MNELTPDAPSRQQPATHQRGAAKLMSAPPSAVAGPRLPKPAWIRAKLPSGTQVNRIKRLLRDQQLASVCEEAACPNLGECFNHGTATFMLMGDRCTRRCPFCDVAHGQPAPLDHTEPTRLAQAVAAMDLRYVVLTSVNRDDLRDGGAAHFAACIAALRAQQGNLRVEILTPDFRGRSVLALDALAVALPDVFNHNLETVPRLYPSVRPGADYQHSLALLQQFHVRWPAIPIKSGLMLGLGEDLDEVRAVMQDLRAHGCRLLTLGQYLQPSRAHLSVVRFVAPEEFTALGCYGAELGFSQVASAPLVRSSYHADQQAQPLLDDK